MKETTKFQIGDHVWFNQNWVGPSVGTITALRTTEDGKQYAKIHLDDGGTTGALLTNMYYTRMALLEANEKAMANHIAEYKAEMPDIEGLVRFMFDNTIATGSGEYTDWDARQAVKERAKDLLNIDLE